MKTRVAVGATLIALIALILLFSFNCSKLADEGNNAVRSRLKDCCTAVSKMGAEISNEERALILSAFDSDAQLFRGLYTSEGEAISVSDDSHNTLTSEDLANCSRYVRLFTQEGSDGHGIISAIYQYEDGAVLLFSMDQVGIRSVIKEYPTVVWFSALLALSILLIGWVMLSASRRTGDVDQVMHTLDQFADGNFDARVEGFSQNDPNAVEYNAILERMQERIFRQKDRNHVLNTVMNQMQNGIIAVDQNYTVIFANAVAKTYLGIIGNPERNAISECSKDVNLEQIFSDAMHQDGVYTNEVAARTAAGRAHRPLRLYVSPMKKDNDVVGALAIIEDITELRRLEQARVDFAANVSHELKTPLTSIQGFVETLEAGAIDNPPMAHKFLKIIMSETERLTRLINDILSISKLEAGDQEVSTERLRLDKIAYDVCEILNIHAEEKQITLNYKMNADPVFIMGNKDQMKQLLINLTENGIKYNQPGGSVTVQVFTNGTEANISISDTGIGIAEEHLPRLFERFYRVDKGRSRQMGGTGLGLAIVKHIVTSMSGNIEVHSKLGEGTEFLVTLPLAPKDNPDKDTIFNDM